MIFKTGKTNEYLLDTAVENLFIGEYMADAPDNYVKVYLYALMCARTGSSCDIDDIVRALHLNQDTVEKAFLYWREKDVIRGDRNEITFVSLKGKLFAREEEQQKPVVTKSLRTKELADLYKKIESTVGRVLGGKEPVTIASWMDDFGASPELIVTAYAYCKKTYNKDNPTYVGKVVKDWAFQGFNDIARLDEYLADVEKSRFIHKQVFNALGFHRVPTEAERTMMNTWFNDWGFSLEKVKEACSKTTAISSPNLNYVNKVLENWLQEKGGVPVKAGEPVPAGVVIKYYEYLREKAETEAEERRAAVYEKLPYIKELDDRAGMLSREISRLMISGAVDREARAKEIGDEIDKIMVERAGTLTDSGLPADYTDVQYRCRACGDTGTLEDGTRCSCFAERSIEAGTWQNSLRK